MDINYQINRLLNYGLQQELLTAEDFNYAANRLLAMLHLDTFTAVPVEEALPEPSPILEQLLDIAVARGLLEATPLAQDLFDTALMDCLLPRPSQLLALLKEKKQQGAKAATDCFYAFSQAANYIRMARIKKNLGWQTKTPYGVLDITINLSKPEKDPRDIAKASRLSASSYPKCVLCRENEGFAGNWQRPARQNLRLLPLELNNRQWFMQYSPYIYYNEHCIVLNKEHVPMHIDERTFANLLAFTDIFPHYFLGSNADLPIVGGSILAHDHYQGGCYDFAMAKAMVEKEYYLPHFRDVGIGRIKWPLSTLRLFSEDKERLVELADFLTKAWRGYSDASVQLLAYTGTTRHNTVTPIARRHGTGYELDLVLRNNRTSEEHPLGIFHPHVPVHHIKKENIGLIEVMGLAVLPARLKDELSQIKESLLLGRQSIADNPVLAKHDIWYQELKGKYFAADRKSDISLDEILETEVGLTFLQALVDAGVFKRTSVGLIKCEPHTLDFSHEVGEQTSQHI